MPRAMPHSPFAPALTVAAALITAWMAVCAASAELSADRASYASAGATSMSRL